MHAWNRIKNTEILLFNPLKQNHFTNLTPVVPHKFHGFIIWYKINKCHGFKINNHNFPWLFILETQIHNSPWA